jgi:hypothetical protein
MIYDKLVNYIRYSRATLALKEVSGYFYVVVSFSDGLNMYFPVEKEELEKVLSLVQGKEDDADHVGALNILSRFYEESEVPHVGRIRDG